MNFKRFLAALLAAFMLATSVGCSPNNGSEVTSPAVPETVKTEEQKFDDYLMDIFKEVAGDNLFDCRYMVRNPEKFGITNIPKTLGQIDFEKIDNASGEWEKDNAELTAFNYSELTDNQKKIYDQLRYDMDLSKKVVDMGYYDENCSPLLGQQSQLPSLLAEFSLYTVQDAYDYLEMLKALPAYFDDITEYQRRRSEKGLFMSDTSVDAVIKSCENFIKNPKKNLLIDTFEARLEQFTELTPEERTKLTEENIAIVNDCVIPAYGKFIENMKAFKGTGKNDGGLASLKNGKTYYEYLVAQNTSSDRSVPEIISMVDRELDTLLQVVIQIVQSESDIDKRMENCKFPDGSPEEQLEILIERSAEFFPVVEGLNYDIKYVHPSMEEFSSPAFFILPQVDEAGNNSIYINSADMMREDDLFTTLAHEGYPGHMYQSGYQNQQPRNPITRLFGYTGYAEGWALYVQMMSYDMAEPTDYKASVMLQCDYLLNVFLCSRADLGINYEGWGKPELKSFLANYGLDMDEFVDNIFYAVVEDPANYLAYTIGYLEIQEMRDYAEDELGDAFDPIAFHKAYLDAGPAPFSFVRKEVKAYVDEAKKAL